MKIGLIGVGYLFVHLFDCCLCWSVNLLSGACIYSHIRTCMHTLIISFANGHSNLARDASHAISTALF